MKDIIDGFLKFQLNAFPERAGLFKNLANQQSPRALFLISPLYSRRFAFKPLRAHRAPGLNTLI